jgi:two-component sensor histidine kinase
MILDLKTLSLTTVLIFLVMFTYMLIQWLEHRKRFQGLGYWISGLVCITSAVTLILLRGSIDDFLSIVIGNVLLLSAGSFSYIGLSKFFSFDSKPWIRIFNVVLVLAFIEQSIFTYIYPNSVIRTAAMSTFIVFACALTIYGIFRANRHRTIPGRIIVWSLYAICLLFIARIPLSYFFFSRTATQTSTNLQGSSILISLLLSLSWTMGFGLLISHEVHRREKSVSKKNALLIQELHHRVKNNFSIVQSLLNLQANSIEDKTSKTMLLESKSRVQAISNLHSLLNEKENVREVNLQFYLPKIAESILRTYHIEDLSLRTNIESILLDIDQAISCGMIVNELLNNACKHGFCNDEPASIKIVGKRIDDKVSIQVQDSGTGFSEEELENNSLGIKLIHSLAQQLQGEITFSNHEGTKAELIFPVHA